MKKIGIINQPISTVISGLGHLDTLAIADAGLPIPPETQRIDLALKPNLPSFLETLDVVLTEMHVEKAIVAEEMYQASPLIYHSLTRALDHIPIEAIPHISLKEKLRETRAVIRTGEYTPFANVILVAGAWGFNHK